MNNKLTFLFSDGTQTSTVPLRIANQLAPRSPVRKTIRTKKRFFVLESKKKVIFLRVTPFSKFSK
jgi:hypothetical protein